MSAKFIKVTAFKNDEWINLCLEKDEDFDDFSNTLLLSIDDIKSISPTGSDHLKDFPKKIRKDVRTIIRMKGGNGPFSSSSSVFCEENIDEIFQSLAAEDLLIC